MKTYYDILEVSKTASDEIIKRAYKVLAKKYHPDLQKDEDKENAQKQMVKINEAYNVLSDPERRRKYDEQIKILEEKELIQKQKEQQNYTKTSGYVDNRPQNNTTGSNVVYNNYVEESQKEREDLYRKAREVELEIEKRRAEAMNQIQEDYYRRLKNMGYKIVYKVPLKKRIENYLIVAVTIIIMIGIYNIPPVRRYILDSIIDPFKGLFNVIDRILTLRIFFGG